jgi:muramoyltetrapeptide carboxypeptidase
MAIFPKKLRQGDTIAIIAPSFSYDLVSPENRDIARNRLEKLGFNLKFGEHIEECDENNSSSLESRIEDFHWAFSDPEIDCVMTVMGGYNSNQLLDYIDWDLIRGNPKPFIGYSDITALQNAMLARSGLLSYSGPGFSSFAEKESFDYTLEYFQKCVMDSTPFELQPSEVWSSDLWYLDQENRDIRKNEGWLVVNEGETEGTLVGGNLCTFVLLKGTKYMPDLHDSILFLEDDHERKYGHFDRDLQSLLHLEAFSHVKGLVLGRFQTESEISNEMIVKMIKSKRELNHIPVIANVDFGHTTPLITFPVGGKVSLKVSLESKIEILAH